MYITTYTFSKSFLFVLLFLCFKQSLTVLPRITWNWCGQEIPLPQPSKQLELQVCTTMPRKPEVFGFFHAGIKPTALCMLGKSSTTFFFFSIGVWTQGLHLESLHQPFFLWWVLSREGLANYLPRLVSNCLQFYRREPLAPTSTTFLTQGFTT
jgi:hypothetical protein